MSYFYNFVDLYPVCLQSFYFYF